MGPLTIFDGEMVLNRDLEKMIECRRFLLFDLLYYKGRNMLQLPFEIRYKKLSEIISTKNTDSLRFYYKKPKFMTTTFTENKKISFTLQKKEFYNIQELRKLTKSIIPKLSHNSDGLIFQKSRDPYLCGADKNLLKWKFSYYNSIDFLFRICQK